jgi:hypothetical protein
VALALSCRTAFTFAVERALTSRAGPWLEEWAGRAQGQQLELTPLGSNTSWTPDLRCHGQRRAPEAAHANREVVRLHLGEGVVHENRSPRAEDLRSPRGPFFVRGGQ